MVLSSQFGAGELRPAERRPARQFRGRAVGQGAARRQRSQRRRLTTVRLTGAIKVILFDIDGTLVLTGGAGGRAMTRAFDDLFAVPDAFRDISMPGRTDSWILSDAAAAHGIASADLARFRDAYLTHLVQELDQPGGRKGVM